MKLIKNVLAIALAVALAHLGYAQDNTVKELLKDSQDDVEALSLYPDDIREAIFETTLHPELLVKMEGIQSKTRQDFNALIKYLPEEDQKKYWELAKYDDLINKLVAGGQKSSGEIEIILKDYPQEVHGAALDFGVSRLRTLEKIDAINRQGEDAVETLLVNYPDKTKNAIHLLLKYPEVIYLLNENLELVILVGDYYAKNPELVRKKADSIQTEASRKYSEQITEWQKGLQEDPRAREEFEKASAEFSQDNGYKEYDPMYPNAVKPDESTEDKNEPQTVNVYYTYHYPYWLGYPAWYPDSYWYWYPYWYHWGYYYGGTHTIIVVGPPSYYFIHWYFSVPYHHYLYPYFSDYVLRYYKKGPGPSRTGLSAAVRDWERDNPNEVTRKLINDDTRRVERLREYGQLERDYQKFNQRNTEQNVSRERYLEQNRNRYPNLNGEVRNTIREREAPQQRTIRTTPPSHTYEINRARDLHQRTWERSNYNQRQRTPATRPSTSTPSRTGTRTGTRRGN